MVNLGKNGYFRIYYQRSVISRTWRKMETYHFSIKNNTTSWEELQDLQQKITCYNGGPIKIEIISTRCYREIWSLDISENYINSIEDGTWSYKIMISSYNIYQEKQI